MPIAEDELSKNAMGGTEQMKYGLQNRINPDVLDKFQIICSRVRDIDPSLIPIYWLHDLPQDPESQHLAQGGFNKFEKLVFVSNWQMQAYINHYGIPWYKCIVMKNAIDPIPSIPKPTDKIKLIYHTTPHRGLNILIPVFIKLAEKYKNIELDVFSSFEIYGWKERDEPYAALFKACEDHPQINYHGFKPNSVVREALQQAHIFAYPSTWVETSCIALMEAMSAGCLCIHPNLGALYETGSNFTWMYQYIEDPRDHMTALYGIVENAILAMETQQNDVIQYTSIAKSYADNYFNWERRRVEWTEFLSSILRKKKITV